MTGEEDKTTRAGAGYPVDSELARYLPMLPEIDDSSIAAHRASADAMRTASVALLMTS